MQSPSSTGLIPASYSRRRRAGVTDTQSSTMYEEIPSAPTTPSSNYYDLNNNNGGSSPQRRTIQNFTSIYATELSIPLTAANKNNNNNREGGKSSDDENDENDQRQNNRLDLSSNSDYDSYDDGYEDVLDKPPKLSDFVINDSCYQRYLIEGKRGKYKGLKGMNIDENASKGIMDPTFLAKVCAFSSCIGMLFLIWVAVMMETQPLYIKGVSPKTTNGNDGDDTTYRFRKETSNALKAAAAYFLTMVLSVIYLQVKEMNLELLNPALMGRLCHLKRLMISTYFRWRRRHYDDIPDNNNHHHFLGVNYNNSYGGNNDDALLQMRNNGDDGTLKSRRTNNSNRRRKKGSSDHGLTLPSGMDRGGTTNVGGGGGVGGAVVGFFGKLFSSGGSKTKRKKDR